MVTVIRDPSSTEVDGRPEGDSLWVAPTVFGSITGYELKPEGACREDVCVPLPNALVSSNEVDTAGFWTLLGRPVLHDSSGSVWLLGEGAVERRTALASLQAPDFTLPDLSGTQHSLSEYRGKKVFLATWASW